MQSRAGEWKEFEVLRGENKEIEVGESFHESCSLTPSCFDPGQPLVCHANHPKHLEKKT